MEQNNLKVLKEINPDPIGFPPQVSNRLKVMIHRMAEGYLMSANYAFELRNTSKILMYIQNSDFQLNKTISSFSSLGDENSAAGALKIFLSEKKLLSLMEEDKRYLISELIHSALVKFAQETEHSTDVLKQAYDQYLSEDLFYNSYPQYQSENKKCTAQIQSRENWGGTDYRLLIKSTANGLSKAYSIASIPHTFFDEMMGITQENMWEVILKTPQVFDPMKWTNEKFMMSWGKDNYEFDPDTSIVTKVATK